MPSKTILPSARTLMHHTRNTYYRLNWSNIGLKQWVRVHVSRVGQSFDRRALPDLISSSGFLKPLQRIGYPKACDTLFIFMIKWGIIPWYDEWRGRGIVLRLVWEYHLLSGEEKVGSEILIRSESRKPSTFLGDIRESGIIHDGRTRIIGTLHQSCRNSIFWLLLRLFRHVRVFFPKAHTLRFRSTISSTIY